MLYVENDDQRDPKINLAIEEFLLKHVQIEQPILLFYINEPSVIIGRNQNTLEEIDPDYVKENQIHLVRRLSGGGAVYHDLGNLNFSFVTPGQEGLHNFERFTEPVIQVLQSLGLDAQLRGRSDIFAEDRKISGNAQYASQGRMFSHGTLLFNTDLEVMLKAINPRQVNIESSAVQSVRNFVANIQELQPGIKSIEDLRAAIIQGIFQSSPVEDYKLSQEDWQNIYRISQERYQTWEWNVGRSPNFNIKKSNRFNIGKVDLRIAVDKGHIQSIKIFGDFLGNQDIKSLELSLIGVRYDPDALTLALNDINIEPYFGGLAKEDFLKLLY